MAAYNLDHIHVAFSNYDDNRRFKELLEIPAILDKYQANIELTHIENQILLDFEITDDFESFKEKIQILIDEWIRNNPDEYTLYEWMQNETFKELLDTKSLSLETRMLFATQPETVKLLQGPTGFDTGRVDGNFNTFLEDYSQKENNLATLKKAIFERNYKLFRNILTSMNNISQNEILEIIYYAIDLGRIEYLKTIISWKVSFEILFIILDKDFSSLILQRREQIFIMIMDSLLPWDWKYDKEYHEKYHKKFVEYLKLSLKDYLPNITIYLLKEVIDVKKLEPELINEILLYVIKHNVNEILKYL